MVQEPLEGLRPSHYPGFMIELRHTTLGKTHLDEWSARCKHFYLTIHNTYKETDIHTTTGIRTRTPNKQAATEPRLRTRGHWDRRLDN